MTELDLETVRAKAKELGVAVHPAQKAETIQANIDTFLADSVASATATATPTAPAAEDKPETEYEQLERLRAEALVLLPVTVTSMDPADANLTAVVVSVGNRRLGQITKAIPFGYKWYMPRILLNHLEEQKFTRSSMVPVPGVPGSERLHTQTISKYAITYHPIPSPAELSELAKAQAQGNELAK